MTTNVTIKMAVFCVVALGLTVLLNACDKSTSTDDTVSSFEGTVTNLMTGEPIESALVYLGDTLPPSQPFVSDSAGHISGAIWGTPTVDIFVKRESYLTEQRRIHLEGHITGVDFRLAPVYITTGGDSTP